MVDMSPDNAAAKPSFAQRVKPIGPRIDDVAGPMVEAAFAAVQHEEGMSMFHQPATHDPAMRKQTKESCDTVLNALNKLALLKVIAATTPYTINDISIRTRESLLAELKAWPFAVDAEAATKNLAANEITSNLLVARMESAMDMSLRSIGTLAEPIRIV